MPEHLSKDELLAWWRTDPDGFWGGGSAPKRAPQPAPDYAPGTRVVVLGGPMVLPDISGTVIAPLPLFSPDDGEVVVEFDPPAAGQALIHRSLLRPLAPGEVIAPPRTCRGCGCTDAFGCEEGCWWVEDDLCNSCEVEMAAAPAHKSEALP